MPGEKDAANEQGPILGQVVAQLEIGADGDSMVDMSAQAPGVYLVQVTIGNTSRTEKLIVR